MAESNARAAIPTETGSSGLVTERNFAISRPGVLGFVERNARILVFAVLLLVWSPILFLRMAGSFQIVDYFGSFIDEYISGKNYLHLQGLLPNLYDNAFVNGFHFRPTWVFIMESMLILFRENYSIQFFVKIAVSAVVVFLSFGTVLRRTGSVYPALFCAVFIIVHPSPVNLYLYTSEAFTEFFLILAIWWMSVQLDIWGLTGGAPGPLAMLKDYPVRKPAIIQPYLVVLLGIMAFIGIAGSKEYGFLIAEMICLCLVVFLIRKYRATAAAGLLLVVTSALALFSVYRVNEVRNTLIRVVAPAPPPIGKAFWIEFSHRIEDGFAYLAPVQLNASVGPVIGVILIGLCILLLGKIAKAVQSQRMTLGRVISTGFALEAVLLVAILATVVLSSVPSGYPPRMSPRYVVPAVAPTAMLLAIAWFEIWPKSRRAMLAFAAFLLLAAPNITYQRDLDWALYNQAFSTYIDLLKRHQQHGDVVIVDIDGEIGNSIVNFFGPAGAETFQHGLSPIPRAAANLKPPARALIASLARPMKFMAENALAKTAIVERIEVVKYSDYHGSGMDHLVQTWNRIGSLAGGYAQPYYESATVTANPGPSFYLYTLCRPETGTACEADVRQQTLRFGDYCELAKTDPTAFGMGEPPAMRVTTEGNDGFTASFSIPSERSRDLELVSTGHFKVERGTLRLRFVDGGGGLLSEDWLDPSPNPQSFTQSLVVRRGDPRPARAEIFAYAKNELAANFECPSLLVGLPVEIVQPAIAYGSFLP